MVCLLISQIIIVQLSLCDLIAPPRLVLATIFIILAFTQKQTINKKYYPDSQYRTMVNGSTL